MGKKKSIGLPGGPNEFLQDITQYISVEGYKSYSPDKNNPVNIIESGSITMQDVNFPVYGVDNLGNEQMMFPENEYQFPGDTVYEIPMAQTGLPEHLQGIDLTKINAENSSNINSEAYRNRLKTEYFNAHNIELSDVDLDNMVGDLNNQLTLGADDGTKGFYTQNVPDPNAAGFMMGGYGQIDEDGNQVNQRTAGYDWNNPTRGNIYVARNASQKAPFNEVDDEDGYVMPGTSMEESIIQHEVNHRLNSLEGSPLSSAKQSPLYDESYKYHNSFFGNAPDDSPFNTKFEDASFREYATQPFEIKSQKAQLEQALSNAGIWDPSKGPFTQADVDKMVERNITFNKGFGYLPRGLGVNELVEGTIKAPGKLTNPMNSYSEYIGDKFNNFLGKKGYEDFDTGYFYGDKDNSVMRNTSSRPFEQIKKNLNSVQKGSKKWNEWSDEINTATTQYYNARGDSQGIKNVLEGEYPDEKTEALLLKRGIKIGPDGWYEAEKDDQINVILNEYQEKTNTFKNARDLISDKRPKEEGLFGAFGPIKNFKGKKAEKEAVKRFNKAYKTDFKNWDDVVFSYEEGNVSQADKNIKKIVTETSVFDDIKTSFDREINTLQDLQKTGGHENRKAFYKNDFKLNGDFRKGRRAGKSEFNIDLANDYMNSLKNNPDTNKEGTDVFDNSYVPPNVFDNDAGYTYFDRKEGKELREQNRTNFKTAVDNDVWRDDLFTQAVLNLRANDRDAFIEYYNQDPDAKYTTKKEIKQQAKLLKQLKSSMPDVRNFLEKRRTETSNFIKDNNSQYEVDKEQQLINDNLSNENLNKKIAPNLIKFMNEVAMEDESMPTNLAKFGGDLPEAQRGVETTDSQKLVDSGMDLVKNNYNVTRPSVGKYENIIELFGGTDCHNDRTCVQAVRDIYENAGLDAGIPKNIYDNNTFAEKYKEYGYELIINKEDRQPGDILQYYYKNGAVDRKFHMGIYVGDNNYVGDGSPNDPMSINNIYEYSDGTTKEPFNVYRKINTKKYGGSLPKAQYGINGEFSLPIRKGVLNNKNGSESTHKMRTETLDGKNWFSFPSLFQNEDGTWIDMSTSVEKDWMLVYEEAKKRGEVIDFGTDKETAIKFGEGSWKPQKKHGGSLPKAQFGWNDFEKSDVGKFVDARGLKKDGEYIMNTVGDYFGYENTPEDARRMSLDATAMINPMPDFINAADHAQQGEYTDAALYATFGILPFSAGPLVKGTKKAFNYFKNTNPLGKNAKIAKELSETLDAATLRNTASTVPANNKNISFTEGKDINLSSTFNYTDRLAQQQLYKKQTQELLNPSNTPLLLPGSSNVLDYVPNYNTPIPTLNNKSFQWSILDNNLNAQNIKNDVYGASSLNSGIPAAVSPTYKGGSHDPIELTNSIFKQVEKEGRFDPRILSYKEQQTKKVFARDPITNDLVPFGREGTRDTRSFYQWQTKDYPRISENGKYADGRIVENITGEDFLKLGRMFRDAGNPAFTGEQFNRMFPRLYHGSPNKFTKPKVSNLKDFQKGYKHNEPSFYVTDKQVWSRDYATWDNGMSMTNNGKGAKLADSPNASLYEMNFRPDAKIKIHDGSNITSFTDAEKQKLIDEGYDAISAIGAMNNRETLILTEDAIVNFRNIPRDEKPFDILWNDKYRENINLGNESRRYGSGPRSDGNNLKIYNNSLLNQFTDLDKLVDPITEPNRWFQEGGSLIELPIAQADATNVYQQNPNIPIAQEETVMPGSGIIYNPTSTSRNPNLQWMMGAQPGVTPGTSYADDVAIGYNELIGATTPIPILEGLQLTSKGARIPGLIDDGIIKPIVKGYKWMKSAVSSGSKTSSSGTKAADELDLEAMADRLDEMNAAFVKSTDPALSKAEKNAAAEIWAAENLDEIAAMNNLIEKNPKLKVSSEIRKKLNKAKETGAFIGDGGSQIKKTDLEVYINPKTGEIEQFHSLKDGKVTAEDLEANLPWEIDWAGNINLDEYSTLLKKIPSHSTPYKKDEFGFIKLDKDKVINYGPWKNQKGGEPAIQDNTFIATVPEVIIDQVSENNKKENQELGLSNILSYMVDTRGGTENLWTDLADNIAYHESGYEQRMDPKAIQRSNEYVDGKKTGNIVPGPGRGMFQFESKELNGSGSFTTAQKRYKNVAEATGLKLNENILNAKEATELSKQDQYTLFFANLIESKAVLKDYADGKLLTEDVWLKGHKNVSADGNKESFRSSVKNAEELPNGIENGYSEFTLEELLPYKNGGEYNIYKDYVNGKLNSKEGKKVYDKLNRVHYKEAKEAGMSPANYIMTNLMGHS